MAFYVNFRRGDGYVEEWDLDSITITVPTLIRSLAMSSAISCKNLLEGNCDFSWHLCTLLNQYFHYEPVQQVLIWFIELEFIIFLYAITIIITSTCLCLNGRWVCSLCLSCSSQFSRGPQSL